MAREILSGLRKCLLAHHVLSVQHLGALLQEALLVVLHLRKLFRLVVPVDLEFGDTGLLGQDVALELRDLGLGWRHLVHLRGVVLNVHVVTNTQEFLVIVVGASQKDSSDTDSVRFRNLSRVGRLSLKHELHLSGRRAFHLGLFKHLIMHRVGSLSNVDDTPC